jgi:hypothetical protein
MKKSLSQATLCSAIASFLLLAAGLMMSSSAHAFSCANCFNEATAHRYFPSLITAVNAGTERIVGALQGAASSQATATSEAGRIISEAGARTAAEMAKNEATNKFQHIDPCSVTAVARGGANMVNQRPRGGGRGSAPAKFGATEPFKETLEISAGLKPAPAPEIAAALATKGACGTFARGGVRETGCRDAGFDVGLSSGFPNADVKAETLFDGPQAQADIDAGVRRKLTIAPGDSKEKMAIAAFIRNLDTPVDLRSLTRGEINSEAGRTYMAFRDSYDASMSMASKPLRDQESLITANVSILPVLTQLGKGEDAPYVTAYLNKAYPNWKRDGISFAELLQLEAGRRYLNADWHARMAGANERQLLAEQVQLQAVGNWLQVQMFEKLQQIAILQGTTAGAGIRAEKLPQLVAAHKAARK